MSGPNLHCIVYNNKFGVKSIPEGMYDGSCMELLTMYDALACDAHMYPTGFRATRVQILRGKALHNPAGYADITCVSGEPKYATFYLMGKLVSDIDSVRYIPEAIRPYYASLGITLYDGYYLGEY